MYRVVVSGAVVSRMPVVWNSFEVLNERFSGLLQPTPRASRAKSE